MKEISFEKALEKLEKIVEELETGDLSLDTSLKKYEEGIKLAGACQKKLDKAKEKIELLMKKDSGRFVKESFEEKYEGDNPLTVDK
jgi:exodeoxyribonuclease VII small subunit